MLAFGKLLVFPQWYRFCSAWGLAKALMRGNFILWGMASESPAINKNLSGEDAELDTMINALERHKKYTRTAFLEVDLFQAVQLAPGPRRKPRP